MAGANKGQVGGYLSIFNVWLGTIHVFKYNMMIIRVYSETTWAVGIAQLTHHEVQGGGKNPETGGRGIFAPTANRVVS